MTRDAIRILFALACAASLAELAAAHGDPIIVGVVDDQLTVSHVENSFPPFVFAEDDDDGAPDAFVTQLPHVGQIVFWTPPGMDIDGMDNASSLSIEPLIRNVKGTTPVEPRLVWYWDAVSGTVEQSAADFYFLSTGQRYTPLSANATTAPEPFLLASTIAGQQGNHNHNLAQWALANNPSAPLGAYGVFARLLASEHSSSEPFLMVFNNGLEGELMIDAANAILDAVAVESAPLAGDYNNDGFVDAADYTVWRNNLGAETEDNIHHNGNGSSGVDPGDYEWWKQNYGSSILADGSGGLGERVPEPAAGILVAAVVLIIATVRNARLSNPWAVARRSSLASGSLHKPWKRYRRRVFSRCEWRAPTTLARLDT